MARSNTFSMPNKSEEQQVQKTILNRAISKIAFTLAKSRDGKRTDFDYLELLFMYKKFRKHMLKQFARNCNNFDSWYKS